MSSNPAKRFTPRFKFQIVLESLKGEKAVGQLDREKSYDSGIRILKSAPWLAGMDLKRYE